METDAIKEVLITLRVDALAGMPLVGKRRHRASSAIHALFHWATLLATQVESLQEAILELKYENAENLLAAERDYLVETEKLAARIIDLARENAEPEVCMFCHHSRSWHFDDGECRWANFTSCECPRFNPVVAASCVPGEPK